MIETLKKFLKQKVVIDTNSTWVFLGTLDNVIEGGLELSEVDVHENNDTATTKEVYIMECRQSGIIPNRDHVVVNLDFVVSVSPLEAVKTF